MHTALRRTFATTAATVLVTGGLLAAAGAASAADLGGCTTTYASDLQYNPNNPKPTYSISPLGVVTVNATGTVAYASNDVADTTKFVACLV